MAHRLLAGLVLLWLLLELLVRAIDLANFGR